ncbi:glycoside hydrolase family 13 protein [Dokdonia donghaensis]|uniref:Oligo-1,6-glucosidase n=1 Tax=Dokdonia donghaensis DSW-1 TaxID=1300343 RepID=A0A0A2GQP7_9FLAO|nr:alpha-glucosidase [Dokdonia donghaensis]ANH61170.1 Oligo-1,6-glucosidase [Dokdonia donghaensis DSW-1]KGO05619.1 oligo-1,6-glucosidase [Dokdonia donghaensis DSW-1]
MSQTKTWWKEGIVYQIYPRSFNDTTGNGIGDLRGIIEKLDYIASLGVTIIWLNPVYDSPNDDNGYDIRDYRKIMAEFGTMEDFDELLSGMKERGLRLIMDLVVNHCSDEHKWFKESRSSRDNAYRDYFHWWPAEKGTPPKRWSYFDVEENAWKYDEQTDAYYLHYFAVKQPDLKWENPAVRKEVYDMMHFWFKKGVDGFRMDVIPFISKDTSYPEINATEPHEYIAYYANGPKVHEYLNELNTEVISKYDAFTVGEGPGIAIEQALDFVHEDRKEMDMFFHFDLMSLDRAPGEVFKMREGGYSLVEFKKVFSDWDAAFQKAGWGSLFLANHDFPRSVSRWGNDSPEHWKNSATLLHTFLLTMRGTPYFYQGDEIGMTNVCFTDIEDYRDINTINRYKTVQNRGGDLEAFMQSEQHAARENARTPMQWDASANAGFTSATPWIKVNPDYENGVNVEAQLKSKHSVLSYFKDITALRQAHPALVYGDYECIRPEHERVYCYTRTQEDQRFLILLNFSNEVERFSLPLSISYNRKVKLISNDKILDDKTFKEFLLRPWQAIVYKLEN